MAIRRLAAALAASALVFSATAAQATSAGALSLGNNPAFAQARASTSAKKGSHLVATPLLIIIGVVATVGVLEATGVINIFDDSPDSP